MSYTTHEFKYRTTIAEYEYKDFIIYKTKEFKQKKVTCRMGYNFDTEVNEIEVKGSVRYEAHMKEECGQAMTEEYKTMKAVKQAINSGNYIEY